MQEWLIQAGDRTKRFISPAIMERAGQTFTGQGKYETFPPLVYILAIGILGVSGHLIGWNALILLPLYWALHRIQMVFLHYTGHGDRRLRKTMFLFSWAMVLMLGITFFVLLYVESCYLYKQYQDKKKTDEYIKLEKKYEKDSKEYNDWLAQRDRDSLEAANQKADLVRELKDLLKADKDRAAAIAGQYDKARRLSAETGQRLRVVDSRPLIDADKVDAIIQSKKDVIKESPAALPPLILVADDYIAWWQPVIKVGQFFEFFISIIGLLFLPLRSDTVNELFKSKTFTEDERTMDQFVVAGAVPSDSASNQTGNSRSNEAEASLPEEAEEKEAPPTLPIEGEIEVEVEKLDQPAASVTETAGEASSGKKTVGQDNSRCLEAVSPIVEAVTAPEKRKMVAICNGTYNLIPRVPKGWKLYHAGPIDTGVRYIVSVTEKEGKELLGAADVDREEIVERLKVEKKKALPPPPSIQERLARRATG